MASNPDFHLLQAAFCLFGHRRRGAASFRRFVILRAQTATDEQDDGQDLQSDELETQPLRISFW